MNHSVPQAEQILKEASAAYYAGEPQMSDAEFDHRRRAHAEYLEAHPEERPADSILDQVGAPPPAGKRVKHAVRMLSLDNVFEGENGDPSELNAWLAGIERELGPESVIVIEPKIDGLSLDLAYNCRRFWRATTRGDGREGDDVSTNILSSVDTEVGAAHLIDRLPAVEFHIRGEVYMDWPTFDQLNLGLEQAGQKKMSHPRNAAAGAIGLDDPLECAERRLRFLVHGFEGPVTTDSYLEVMGWIRLSGLHTPSRMTITAGERIDSIGRLKEAMGQTRYPTDGLVFKVDSLKARERLGCTSRAPRWATALKFKAETVETTLNEITVQVSRAGVLTVVAELEPVWCDGATISRATLHNEDQVNRLRLQVGDRVMVGRSAGVIPCVYSSVTAMRRLEELWDYYTSKYGDDGTTLDQRKDWAEDALRDERPAFSLLDHIGGKCPSCGGTDISKRQVDGEDGSAWCCNNPGCPAQLARRIQHFCGRKALDIEGVGEECSDAIALRMRQLEGDVPPHPMNILQWSRTAFAELSWTTESGGQMTFGHSRAGKAVRALEAASSLPLNRWLYALGIPTVGENTAREISRLCKDPDELLKAVQPDHRLYRLAHGTKKDDVMLAPFAISHHLGPIGAMELVRWAHSPDNQAVLQCLQEWGVKSDNYNPMPESKKEGKLAGLTFVVTGTLSVKRDEFEARLKAAGATISGSVSKKTSYLVAGEDCGSKLAKAQAAGVPVISESEAERLMEEGR